MAKNNAVCDLSSITDAEKRVLDRVLCAVSTESNAHSYIIEGGSALSRFRCAVYIACAVVCVEKNGGMPCFKCNQCSKIISDQHTDIKMLGGEDGDIKVDDIRAISKEAYVLPTDCDHHIYILRDSDRMNSFAQNALLKIMEEPPQNTLFLLLSPSKELLLPTVVSRAQALTLGKSSIEEMQNALMARYSFLTPQTALRAAKLQSGLDKIELDTASLKALDAAYDVVYRFFVEKKSRINELLPKTRDPLVLTLSILAMASRDIAVSKYSDSQRFVFEQNSDFETACGGFSLKRAMELYEAFSKAAERINNAGNQSSVLAELFCAVKK